MIYKIEEKSSSMNRKFKNDLYTVYGRKKFLNVNTKYNERFQPVLNNGLFCGQDYKKLNKHHRDEKTLFQDPIFRPNRTILCRDDKKKNVIWKRPKDIITSPEFITQSATRFDVNQGHAGDCWFLSAISSLTDHKDILENVVDTNQTTNPNDDNYTGIFHFKFWQYGMWIDIVIDDYLPTIGGRLIYVKSTDKNEFWIALLEKAYAKLYGTYESIGGGNAIEAIEDMTGGCGIELKLSTTKKEDLINIIQKSSFVCCATDYRSKTTGLVSSHVYSVTGLYGLTNGTTLICVRNPWGKHEWTGDWSDKSRLWDTLSNDEIVKHVIRDDGEFFMSIEDFMENYSHIQCCNVTTCTKKWKEFTKHGTWIKGKNAIGHLNNNSFHMNPQYVLDVPTDDTVVISLLQQWTRLSKYHHKKHTNFIGYKVYKIKRRVEKVRLGKELTDLNPVYTTIYIDSRSNTNILHLKKGCYVIIPSTFYPNKEGDYSLRVFSKLDITLHEC